MEELSKTPSLQRGAATRCVSCRKRFAQDEQTFQLTIDRSRKESTVQFDHDTVCADCFKKAEALSMVFFHFQSCCFNFGIFNASDFGCFDSCLRFAEFLIKCCCNCHVSLIHCQISNPNI